MNYERFRTARDEWDKWKEANPRLIEYLDSQVVFSTTLKTSEELGRVLLPVMICTKHGSTYVCYDEWDGGVYWCEECKNG